MADRLAATLVTREMISVMRWCVVPQPQIDHTLGEG